MRILPLCSSPELGAAIAFATARYRSLAGGARPLTKTLLYKGVESLLCRIVLAADPVGDVVQILQVNRSRTVTAAGGAVAGGAAAPLFGQAIRFITDEWDSAAATIPFYPSGPHSEALLALDATGTVEVFGGESGQPVVLTSSNPSIVSVSTTAPTFAQVVTASAGWPGTVLATSPNLVYDGPFGMTVITPQMSLARFTLTRHGSGTVYFTLSQSGAGIYEAAPTQVSGEIVLIQKGSFAAGSTGGAVAGGAAQIRANNTSYFVSEGGAVVRGAASVGATFVSAGGAAAGGGSAAVRKSASFASTGGAAAGGAATRRSLGYLISSGGAVAGGRATIGTGFASAGGVVAGGAAQVAAGYSSTGGAVAAGKAAIGVGLTSTGGAVAGGGAVATTATGSKPIALAFSHIFTYAETHSNTTGVGAPSYVNLRGAAVRGGTLAYAITAVGSNCTVTTDAAGLATFTPTGSFWYGLTWFEYKVTETKDGVALTSDAARVTVTVSMPSVITYTAMNGSLTWRGGAHPYTLRISGTYTNLSIVTADTSLPSNTYAALSALDINRRWALTYGSGGCTTSGYVKVTDSIGQSISVPMSSIGVPTCGSPPPTQGWKKIWFSTEKDIRTYQYWNSYLTRNLTCQWVSPIGIALLEIVSQDGKYKLVGNYWNPANGGYPSQQGFGFLMEIDLVYAGANYGFSQFNYVTGLNFAPASFPNMCYTQKFYARELWHYE